MERDHLGVQGFCRFIISTHTLTWSVTQYALFIFGVCLYFNSHAHVERDIRYCDYAITKTISTHTLTWSVTGAKLDDNAIIGNFNSHAHVERDPFCSAKLESLSISTHTLTWSVTV